MVGSRTSKDACGGCPVDGIGRDNERISLSGGSSRHCNYCQRELSESFLFCPYCGKQIRPRDGSQGRWYHSGYAVALGLATLGPFALPMVWSHPRYRVFTKIALTVLILALTVLLTYILVIACIRLVAQIRELTTVY
jgi:hypothetical protein